MDRVVRNRLKNVHRSPVNVHINEVVDDLAQEMRECVLNTNHSQDETCDMDQQTGALMTELEENAAEEFKVNHNTTEVAESLVQDFGKCPDQERQIDDQGF